MPLTEKGKKILANFEKEYGAKGKGYFYASANAGKITGVHDRARDMERSDWRGGLRWLLKFFAEEMREPEHQEGGADEAANRNAAGMMFVTKDGRALFLKRSGDSDHEGEWAWPGGNVEGCETPLECALREIAEETGHCCEGHEDSITAVDHTWSDDSQYVTFGHLVDEPFEPKLNPEHSDYVWRSVDHPPQPLHPGVKITLDKARKAAESETGWDAERDQSGKLSETNREQIGEAGSEKREDMPESVFLGPNRTYPVKEKRDGEWQYTENLLLAAARRARLEHEPEIAKRADEIRAREFGGAEEQKAADIALAMDRAPGSARSYDSVGRLHVDQSNISKATVNPYRGDEIPDHEKLGLDPRKTYQLLRHPDELAKAAHSFNNLPVLIQHRAVSADDYQPDLVVGSTGTDAEYKHPYLTNSLVVWAKPAIDEIEKGDQQQLSCSYGYTADMTPGEYEGKRYDGVMRNIVGNHLALVREGRAGPDVMVGDSLEGLLMTTVALSPKAALTKGALMTYLRPKLAADAKIDLNPIVEGVTAENFHSQRPIMVAALKMATRGRLAHDADIEDLQELLEAIEAERGADETDPNGGLPTNFSSEEDDDREDLEDNEDKILDFLEDKVEPEHLAHVAGMMRADNPDDENEEEKEDRSAFEQRAADARVKLGHDETEEECERREMRERAADARRRLGRDETEEERRQREEGDRRARDAHRAFRMFRHARDALYAHRRASDRKGIDRGWRAHDKKLAHDLRVAHRLLRRRRAADRGYRLGFRKRAHDQMPYPKDPGVTREAMDAAIARSIAQRDQQHREARAAETFVRPIVGELAVAYDSAEEVYRAALDMRGVDVRGIHPSAFRALLEAQQQRRSDTRDTLGMDAKSRQSFEDRYPGADRIQTM